MKFSQLIGGSYRGRTLAADAERSVNLYTERIQSSTGETKTDRILVSRPGLKEFKTLTKPSCVSQTLNYEIAYTTPVSVSGGSSAAWSGFSFKGPAVWSAWGGDSAPKGIYQQPGLMGTYTYDYRDLGIPDTPANAALAANWTDYDSALALFQQVTFYLFTNSQTRTVFLPNFPGYPTVESKLDVYAVWIDLAFSDGGHLRLWPSSQSIIDNGLGAGGALVNPANAVDRNENTYARISRTVYQTGAYATWTNADRFGYQLKLSNFVP
jgi:hypothetical protein